MPVLEDVEPAQLQLVDQVEDDAVIQQNAEVVLERPAEDNDVEFVRERWESLKKSKLYLISNLKLFSEKLKECVSSRILKVRKKVEMYLKQVEETF